MQNCTKDVLKQEPCNVWGTRTLTMYSLFLWNSDLTGGPEFLFAKSGSLSAYQPSSHHGNRHVASEGLDADSQGFSAKGRPVALMSPCVTLTASWRDDHSLPMLQVTKRKLVAFPRPLSFSGTCLPGELLRHSPGDSARHVSPRRLARV